MRLTRLKTENFRNLAAVDVTPAPGVNVIYGENAQGKTNLIEAIYLLTGQKSFRAAKESDYLRFGQEVARIEAEFTCQNRGGKGVKCYKITEKTGNVIGAKAVNEENEIMMITTEGIIIRITCAGISILGRITSGVKLINLDEGVTVASLAKVREKAEGNTENGSSEEPTEETEEVFEEEDSQDTNDAE